MEHSVTTESEVERFLASLKAKLNSGGRIIFLERDKNEQALADLGITGLLREDVIKSLAVEDYSEGPNDDTQIAGGKPLWVFGKLFLKQEIYIKIKFGYHLDTICISFHIAERPMAHPYKKKQL